MDRQRRNRLLTAAVPAAAACIAALLTQRGEFYALALLFFVALLLPPRPRRTAAGEGADALDPITEPPSPTAEADAAPPPGPAPERDAASEAIDERLREERRGRGRAERSARLHRRVAAGLRRQLHATIATLRDGDRRDRLARAASLARRLADLEDLAAIEGDCLTVERRPFSPRRLTEELLARHGTEAAGRGLTLLQRCDEAVPAALIGDPGRLGRALDHLMENAIEANAPGVIRLALEAVNPGGERLRLRVTMSDEGPGMSRRRIAVLTEPGSDHDEGEGGATGLFFARALTEAMGGCLGVESAPGEGSRFWLELPVEASDQPIEAPDTATTVLVAEDEEATRLIITALLEQSGCRVVTAADGRQAVERAAECAPRLVLMDLQMPEMDGFEAARRILAQSAAPPSIVAMSATDDPREEARAHEAGMGRFIAKPLTLDKLRGVLSPVERGEGPERPATEGARTEEAPSHPIFNPQRLTEMIFDLSAVWIDKVTRTSAVSISESAEALAAANLEGDLEPLRAAAHKLKGAAGNNGLERLRALAAELEQSARTGDRAVAARLLPEVDPLVEQSLEALAAWKANPRG